jgi:hypothetical protein
VVEHLLRESANFLTEARNPPGCLFVRGALSCSEAADAIQKELAARRAASEVKLRDRLEVAKNDGKLPPELDPTDYARYRCAWRMGTRAHGPFRPRQLAPSGWRGAHSPRAPCKV